MIFTALWASIALTFGNNLLCLSLVPIVAN